MTKDDIQLLYEYDHWANNRVYQAVSALSAEQFTRDLGGSFRSVRDTLLHIIGGEWSWLAYWNEPSPSFAFLTDLRTRRDALFNADAFPNVSAVQLKWAEVEEEQTESVNRMTNESLETMSTFDAPNAGTGRNQGTFPFAVDTAGDIAGYYIDAMGVYHGFLRPAANVNIISFDATNAGTIKNQGTRAFGIDTAGDITGLYTDASGLYHGFVRAANGTITDFDEPSAGTSRTQGTFPFAIDTAGDIAGFYLDAKGLSHGFVRTAANGMFTSFDAPGAGTVPLGLGPGTFPFAINTAGNIAGLYLDAKAALHGFMRAASGTITSFDAPGAGTGAMQGTGGLSINSLGNIAAPP